MNDTVVLAGDCTLLKQIDGDLSLSQSAEADAGLVFVRHESGYPVYDGPTTFTPGAGTQTILTAEKTLLNDITIEPIPSNYGLITWDGQTITVS